LAGGGRKKLIKNRGDARANSLKRIDDRDVCLLSNIMELDGTQLVVQNIMFIPTPLTLNMPYLNPTHLPSLGLVSIGQNCPTLGLYF